MTNAGEDEPREHDAERKRGPSHSSGPLDDISGRSLDRLI